MQYLVEIVSGDHFLIDVPSHLAIQSYHCAKKAQDNAFNVIGELKYKRSIYFYKTSFFQLCNNKEVEIVNGETKYYFQNGKKVIDYCLTFDKDLVHIGPFTGHRAKIENCSSFNRSSIIDDSIPTDSMPWQRTFLIAIVESEKIDKPGFFEYISFDNFNTIKQELDKKTLKHLPKIINLLNKKKNDYVDDFIIKLQKQSKTISDTLNSKLSVNKESMRYHFSV